MSKSRSKILSPKAWYLLAAGGVALAADGTRRLLRRRRQENQTAQSRHEQGESIPVTDYRSPVTSAPQAAPVAATMPLATNGAADDLTIIKGIGPVFAKRLNEAGIATFADLAKASADHLRQVTNASAVADPEEWIAQARSMK